MFTTEVVGVVALLSAMMILLSTIFSVGLNFSVQHFISYYIGKNDPGSLRGVVKEISIILILVSILAIVFMWFSSPAFAYLFFHTYRYIDIIRIMGFLVVANLGSSVTGGMVLGLQKFRVNALISIA
jgi:O-antigen/teichoic acid export membrane protein